jgi:hypothetical protein
MHASGPLPAEGSPRSAWWPALAVAAAVLAFSGFQYLMPAQISSRWALNPGGVAQFRDLFHVTMRPLDAPAFKAGFLICLAAMAAAYLALLVKAPTGVGGTIARRSRLVGAVVLMLAVLAPPSLSPDVYAYVGYARLAVVHHLNPYLATQKTLIALHDVTAPFLRWPIASPYGPLWTLLCMAVEWPLRFAPTALAVIALKLIGALAVLFLAEGGRRLAQHLAPGTGPRAYLALAFNPLLLVEGVGNAHNDIVMMAGVVWALVFAARGSFLWSFAFVGVFAAVKFLPVLLAPWLLLVAARRQPLATQLRLAVMGAALAVSPSILGYTAFWHGAGTFTGLRSRWSIFDGGNSASHPAITALVPLAGYGVLSIWIARGDLGRVVRAWIVESLLVFLFVTGIWFPWYLTWPWTAALVLPRDKNVVFSAVLFFVVFLLMSPYVL